MSKLFVSFAALSSLVLGLGGCSSNGDAAGSGGAPATATNSAMATCMAQWPTATTFAANMTGVLGADAGGVTVTLETATPSPPIVGQNNWTLRVLDANGTPVTGATLEISQWMPAHMHPGPNFPKSVDMGGGEYQLQPVDFSMDGFWQNHVEVKQSTMGIDETADFNFCLE
jgi:hypothetical protein